jgi:hypothetical protein
MTPPAAGRLSPTTSRQTEHPETSLLERLAAAGEDLTHAIVHHDLDAIVAATKRAEELVGALDTHERARRDPANDHPGDADEINVDPHVIMLGARIGATARRNALLLERAWATDAALLRLLAVAARDDAAVSSGAGYAPISPDAQPTGWLDRSA